MFVISIGFNAIMQGQSTVFLQENFDGKKRNDLVNLDWEFSSNNNSAVDVDNDALSIKGSIWNCTPVINEDVSNYDQVVVSFKYKNPSPVYGSADRLQVYIAEDYYWSDIQGEQQLLLTIDESENWQFASFTISNWNASQFRLCFKYASLGGLDVFIEDVMIKGVNATPGALPGVNIDASSRIVFEGDELQLFDVSTEAPTSFDWSLSGTEGVDWDFVAPSTKSVQNPIITFYNKGFYDVTLKATNSNGESSQTFMGFITVSCPAISNNINEGHIDRVTIVGSDLDNQTNNSAYSSYFDLAPDLDASNSFTLDVSLANVGGWRWDNNGGARNVRCWLDWDKDGFYDDGYYDLTVTKQGSNYSATVNITPPVGLMPGLVSMRLKLADKSADVADACGNVGCGEVEDYAINFYSGEVTSFLGNCISFNGGYAEAGAEILPNGTTSFTLEGWVFASSGAGSKGFFGQSNDVELGIENGQLKLWSEAGQVSVPWNYSNNWVHVAATGDASTLNLYINGVLKGTTSTVGVHVSTPVSNFIMADGVFNDVATDDAFIGRFDEVRVWNTARTATEIKQYMYQTVPGGSAGLQAYYQFNEGVLSDQLNDWEGLNHLALSKIAENYMASSVPYIWDTTVAVDDNCSNSVNWSWDATEMPRAGNKAIIPTNGSVQVYNGSDLSFGTLELSEGAHFTVQSGGALSISDSLIMNSTTDFPASLNDQGVLTVAPGKCMFNMFYPAQRYWYVGHAVDGATSADYNAVDQAAVKVYEWNSSWQQITDNSTSFNEAMKGYAVSYFDPTTVSHMGSFHSGNYSETGLSSDWHLMANPYPSYLDLGYDDSNAANFTFTNIPKFIYTRTTIGSERVAVVWDIQNSAASHIEATQYVSPKQAFWVSSIGSGEFVVNNAARIHDTGGLKAAKVESDNILKVTLGNRFTYDYAAVVFGESGSESLTAYDAPKINSNNGRIPQIFTMKDGKKLVINRHPAVSSDTQIDLYQSVGEEGAGELTFTALNIADFDAETSVWLEDLDTGMLVNLRENPVYTYSSGATSGNNRLVLHINKVTTSVDDLGDGSDEVSIYTRDRNAVVSLQHISSVGVMRIFDLLGRKIVDRDFDSAQFEVPLPDYTAYYIVEITVEGKVYHQKIVIQ